MTRSTIPRILVVVMLLLTWGLTMQPQTSAYAASPPQGPSNGDYQNGQQAQSIASLPYTSPVLDTSNGGAAYINGDEPNMNSFPVNNGCNSVPWDGSFPGPAAGQFANPAWYSYTATSSGFATANTFMSNYDTAIAVYSVTGTPTGPGSFTPVACDDNVTDPSLNNQETSAITWNTTAGTMYYIMVVASSGNNDQAPGEFGGKLHFHMVTGSMTSTGINQTATEGHALANVPIATFVDTHPATCSNYVATVQLDGQTETVSCSAPTADLTMSCQTTTDTICTIYTTHTYAEETNAFTAGTGTGSDVFVTVSDTLNNDSTTTDADVTVVDAALTHVHRNDTIPAVEGQQLTAYLGTFTDQAGTGPGGSPSYCDINDYTAQINWGDNTNTTMVTSSTGTGNSIVPSTHDPGPCTFDVYGQHTYLNYSSSPMPAQNVTVTVSDAGLPFPCITGCTPQVTLLDTVNVADAPVDTNPAPLGSLTAVEGQQQTLALGSITYHNPVCPTDYLDLTVNWGDGTSDTLNAPNNPNSNGSISYGPPGVGANPCVYTITGVHTYAEENAPNKSYTVTVSGDLTTGTKFSFTTDVTVTDAALNPDPNAPLQLTGTEGAAMHSTPSWTDPGQTSTMEYLGTFHDTAMNLTGTPNPDNPTQSCDINDYTVTVDWGDAGVNPAGHVTTLTAANHGIVASGDGKTCDFDLLGTYTYQEETTGQPPYTVSINVVDAGGKSTSWTDQATIADANLDFVAAQSPTSLEGHQLDFQTLGVFHDEDPFCQASDYTVNTALSTWGDGSSVNGVASQSATPDIQIHSLGNNCDFEVDGTHTYGNASPTYNINLVIMDNKSSVTLNPTVNVNDSTLQVVNNGVDTGTEDTTLTNVPFGTFQDNDPGCTGASNPSAEYTVSIDWGDGVTGDTNATVTNTGTTPCQFTVTGASHLYTEESGNAPYVAKATITDGPGGEAIVLKSLVTVADAALTANATTPNPIPFTEGQAIGQTLIGSFTDSVANGHCDLHDYSGNIAWGDGQNSPVSFSNGSITAGTGTCVFNVYGNHTYADTGSFNIQATISDAGGATVTLTNTATQATDAKLTSVQQGLALSGTEGSALNNVYLGEFHDTNTNCDVNEYSAAVNWDAAGGGATTTLTAFNGGIQDLHDGYCDFKLYGTYSYAEEGAYSINIVVTNNTTGATPATVTLADTATIADAALSSTPLAVQYFVTEGQPDKNRFLGTIHDSDPNCNANDYTVVIDWGDSTPSLPDAVDTTSGYVDTSTPGSITPADCNFKIYGSHTFPEETTKTPFQVKVTVIDDAPSGASTTFVDDANVYDAPLTSAANANTATEGQPFTNVLLGTFTDTDPGTSADPGCHKSDYTISILWNDSPFFDKGTGYILPTSTPCVYNVYSSGHTFPEEGDNTADVQITDAGGSVTEFVSHFNTADASLVNVPVSPTAVEGAAFTNKVIGSFTDTDPGCVLSDYTLSTINWGDGTGIDSTSGAIVNGTGCTFNVTGSHTFPESGTYTVTFTVTDKGGATLTINTQVAVSDAPLTGGTTLTINATEGQQFTNVALGTFTDADPDCGPASNPAVTDYSATVNWGDGTAIDSTSGSNVTITRVSGCTFEVSGSHLYAEEGTYHITVTVTDNTGHATATLTPTAVVADASLQGLSNLSTQNCTLFTSCVFGGTSLATSIAAFHDTSTTCNTEGDTAPHYTVSINWGDGTPADTTSGTITQATPASGCTFYVGGTHMYTVPNSAGYTITVTIHDEGGATYTSSSSDESLGKVVVGVPKSSLHRGGLPNSMTITYGFPSVSNPSQYGMSLSVNEYNNGLFTGKMTFKDPSNGLLASNCQLTTTNVPCHLNVLSFVCTQGTTPTGTLWAKYTTSTTTRYLRLDLTSGGTFKVTTQNNTNPTVPIVSQPPTTPAKAAVKVSCTP